MVGTPLCFPLLRILNNDRCGFNQLNELSGSLSVSSFSSGECGNAILQYCYGFSRLQLWLLAQGPLQSILSLQVSVAMPYYSIVMVSIGVSSGS